MSGAAGQALGQMYGGMMQAAQQLGQAIAQKRMMASLQDLQGNAEHGDAEFQTLEQRIRAGIAWQRPASDNPPFMPILGSTGGETVWKGTTWSGAPKVISQISGNFYEVYPGARHGITLAPNDSGKSKAVLKTNLLMDNCSAIINDPKAEHSNTTASYRQQVFGHRVNVLDPFGVSRHPREARACYNPLDTIRLSKAPEAYALLMSHTITPDKPGETNPFFSQTARQLFQGVALFVAFDHHFKDDQRHFGTIRAILTAQQEIRRIYFSDMASSSNIVVQGEGNKALDRLSKKDSRDDVVATLLACLPFLNSPEIIHCMSRSSFNFRTFRKTPDTVYLVLPAGLREAYGGWQRLILLSAMVSLESIGEAAVGDQVVRFYLDEFATSLGHFEELLTYFPVGRSYGMRFWLFLQNIGQARKIYGKEGTEAFLENAGFIQAFGGNSGATAEMMSELLGKRTITVGSQNRSTVWGQGGASASYSESLMAQPLLTADQISRLPRGEQIIVYAGLGPVRTNLVREGHFAAYDRWASIPLRERNPEHAPPALLQAPAVTVGSPLGGLSTPTAAPVARNAQTTPALPKRSVRCPSCGMRAMVAADQGRRELRCPSCRHQFSWSPN